MQASSQRTWQLRLALMLILGAASVAVCVAAFMWWKAPTASAQVVAYCSPLVSNRAGKPFFYSASLQKAMEMRSTVLLLACFAKGRET